MRRLEDLAAMVKDTSLCGLGQTAPNPVLTTLRYFRDEYLAHIVEKRCPARVCRELLHFEIDQVACKGCSICARACPVQTIHKVDGQKKFYITNEQCIHCGACFDACRFEAVIKTSSGRSSAPKLEEELVAGEAKL